ncbi:myosin-IIIa-like [Sycon ciliatum]|uniref:myosin-IIIa-like n=1 Tax=Sycon ciliatum TaxID=27933 RepID=UPI0031F66A45
MEEGASAEEELDLCWDDDDLSALPELDEATLLRKLHERYDRGRIYSYVGDILIAINPFRRIPLYDDKHHELYNRMDSMQDVAPHIFAIGDCAYRALCVTGSDQVVVISGESGAGKTETAKHLIRHVLQVCHSTHSDIGDQILKVNPLLESLGNAGTVMNKNSSRFGKFLRLHFTHQGTITGASLAHYLLEKSRVVQQNKSESNFHIFYQLMAGLSVEQKGRLGLTEYRDFKYLNNSGTSVDLPSQSQLRDQFDELQQAMSIVGFEESDINGLVSSIAAILHIGNLSFTDKSDKAKLLNPDLLSHVASLIGVDSAQLLAALTLQVTVACGETIKRFNTKKQAIEFRDSLAKLIYSCIFEWVISLLNTMLSPEGIDVKSSTTSIDGKTSAAPPEPSPELGDADITKVAESRRAPDICVLDIFGFENFSYNSFEQYCINIVNEQLHYYFNQCIFAWELQEYAREGIHGADGVSYTNNQETVQLFFGKPLGMLALLDEESKLQKATALTLCSKFSHNCKSHPSFVKSKQQSRPLFAIMHYAGKVDYDASSFLSKNQDTISDAIISCLQESSNEFIQTAINTHTKNQALYSGEMPKNVGNVLLKCEIPAFQVSSKSILSGGSKRLPDHQDS